MKINNRLLITSLLVLPAVFNISGAKAAPTAAPTGITVSPAFQQITIQASELEHPVSFSITNDKPVAQTLNLSSADFNTLNESGGLLFVGTIPNEVQKKYSLSQWLSLPVKQITIAPKQTVVVNANILNLPSMPPGGHYGALMISTAGSLPANKIGLQPIASSLLFVTKVGGDTHILNLSNVYFSHSIVKLPSTITLRFRNNGNTHLIPRGEVAITNSKGKLISKGIINENSGIILPETFRRYDVPLQTIASAGGAGSYKLKVDFRFDGINQFRSYQSSFFYLPLPYWLLLIAGLALVGLYIYGRYKNKSNNR